MKSAGKIDFTNPATLNFYAEMFEKEMLLRDRWNRKNREMILAAAHFRRAERNHTLQTVAESVVAGGMSIIARDHKEAGRYKHTRPKTDLDIVKGIKEMRHNYPLHKVGLAVPGADPHLERPDTNLKLDPIMRPVDPKIRSLLYKWQPHRQIYLNERTKLKPEDKYYFSQSTNWDYGWRLRDNRIKNPPVRSSSGNLRKLFNNRVGPTPDPDHYKEIGSPRLGTCE